MCILVPAVSGDLHSWEGAVCSAGVDSYTSGRMRKLALYADAPQTLQVLQSGLGFCFRKHTPGLSCTLVCLFSLSPQFAFEKGAL